MATSSEKSQDLVGYRFVVRRCSIDENERLLEKELSRVGLVRQTRYHENDTYVRKRVKNEIRQMTGENGRRNEETERIFLFLSRAALVELARVRVSFLYSHLMLSSSLRYLVPTGLRFSISLCCPSVVLLACFALSLYSPVLSDSFHSVSVLLLFLVLPIWSYFFGSTLRDWLKEACWPVARC